MTPITRIWLAFAALGAALIHLAMGAGAGLPAAVILVALGGAELAWGVAVLARDRLIAPRAALVMTLVPVFLLGVIVALGGGLGLQQAGAPLSVLPIAVSSLFNLFVGVSLAIGLRRAARMAPARQAAPVSAVPAGRYLLGLVAAGVLVSGLTTPALAATEVGSYAVPHGSHPAEVSEHKESGHSH